MRKYIKPGRAYIYVESDHPRAEHVWSIMRVEEKKKGTYDDDMEGVTFEKWKDRLLDEDQAVSTFMIINVDEPYICKILRILRGEPVRG